MWASDPNPKGIELYTLGAAVVKSLMNCACSCPSCAAAAAPGRLPVMSVELLDVAVPQVSLGIYPKERQAQQPVVVHLRLGLDVHAVARTDAVEHTADYAAVVACVHAVCTAKHYELLESLVMAVARQLVRQHPTVMSADVTIEKTQAPVAARVAARWRLTRDAAVALDRAAAASGARTAPPPSAG